MKRGLCIRIVVAIVLVIILGIYFYLSVDDTVKNCGESILIELEDKSIDYQTDDVQTCLGNAILNECENAKGILTEENKSINYEILTKQDKACYIKFTFSDNDLYLECPYSNFKDLFFSENNYPTDKEKAQWAVGIYTMAMLETLYDKGLCYGTLKKELNKKITSEDIVLLKKCLKDCPKKDCPLNNLENTNDCIDKECWEECQKTKSDAGVSYESIEVADESDAILNCFYKSPCFVSTFDSETGRTRMYYNYQCREKCLN